MVSRTSGGFALVSNGDRTMGFEGQERKTYSGLFSALWVKGICLQTTSAIKMLNMIPKTLSIHLHHSSGNSSPKACRAETCYCIGHSPLCNKSKGIHHPTKVRSTNRNKYTDNKSNWRGNAKTCTITFLQRKWNMDLCFDEMWSIKDIRNEIL